MFDERETDIMSDENDYDEKESFEGFSIVDDAGDYVDDIKNIAEKLSQDEESATIATPIPDNEITVILDKTDDFSAAVGDTIELKFDGDETCFAFYNGEKQGSFKTAFVKKIKAENSGRFVKAVLYSEDSPCMVKMFLSDKKAKGAVKI